MTLNALAERVGRTVPAVMTMQRKYGLPIYEDYCDGYAVLLKKVMYLATFAIPPADIKALLRHERDLLELLKTDSIQDRPDWFESLCTMRTGHNRLLLSSYNIGHAVDANTVQTGLDFRKRAKELFDDREMGADVLRGLRRYAETRDRIRNKLTAQQVHVREAMRWVQRVTGSDKGKPGALDSPVRAVP